jgi:L-fuculose-phosphate aldolase
MSILLKQERELVVEYGKKMVASGLVTSTNGNISVLSRQENRYAISPSGIDYELIKPEDVVVMDLNDQVVDGFRKPSSEYRLHSVFYNSKEDVGAVVHTHSPYATTVACLNQDLPAVHYTIAHAGKVVPCAPYATFGTNELASIAHKVMGSGRAVLLANHGLLAVGEDIAKAFIVATEIEYLAGLYYRASSIGTPVIIPDREMETVIEKFKYYGQQQEFNRDNDQ